MRGRYGSWARAAGVAGLAVVLGTPALAATPTIGRPELAGSLGSTFSVLGASDQGGAELKLSALWPTGGPASPMRMGIGLWAADAGQKVERLLDPNDAVDLGAVGGPSLAAYGGGLVADLHPGWGRARAASVSAEGPYLNGTAGLYVVSTALRGRSLRSVGAVGWSAGGGWRFRVAGRFAVGPSVHYARVFDDELGRFLAAGLDWVWR
jgi:hypothetical protein